MKQERADSPSTVLFLITKATQGGAQRYVYDLATRVGAHGYTPVVAFGTEGRLSKDLAAHAVALYPIPALARNIALLSDIASFIRILRCIRDIAPDVVHLNSSKAAGLGALAARIRRVPRIVFTVHGWPFKEERILPVRFFIYILSWLTALLSHHVIVVSASDKERGERMWFVKNRIQHIPLGREPLTPLPPHDAFRAVFGSATPPRITPDTLRIVSIAELTANKGIAFGIAAIAHLAERGVDCIYVVVGDGEERARLEADARRLGVQERVFFTGYMQDASRFLTGFDVYLLPSIKEGMPYVLMEARMAGVPIVATDALDDIDAAEVHARIVRARDTVATADALQELSRSPRTVAAGTDVYPLEPMIEKTVTLYTA